MIDAENVQTSSASPVLDYNSLKEMHPNDIVLYQVGDFFEIYGEDARQAASLLNLNLTTRNIPDVGRVAMCGVPAHTLEMYVEKLRDKYDVTIAEAPDFRGERHIYTLRSIDHEAENAINAYEAESSADGNRVFREPAEPPQPSLQELFDRYKLSVGNKGRVNKRNRTVLDLEIDEDEAEVIRLIFHKYVDEGYGAQRLSHYLHEQGIKSRDGKGFPNTTVNRIIKNIAYTGIIKNGESQSGYIAETG